jgi:hypothetical protein
MENGSLADIMILVKRHCCDSGTVYRNLHSGRAHNDFSVVKAIYVN